MIKNETLPKAQTSDTSIPATNPLRTIQLAPKNLSEFSKIQEEISIESLKCIDVINSQKKINTNCKKPTENNSFLNKSNDCLVTDLDDEENNKYIINSNDETIGGFGVLNLKKGNKNSKVLFDLNESKLDAPSKSSNSTIGNNIRRISSNFSNRITNNKQSKYGKRKNSSSSSLAAQQQVKFYEYDFPSKL